MLIISEENWVSIFCPKPVLMMYYRKIEKEDRGRQGESRFAATTENFAGLANL